MVLADGLGPTPLNSVLCAPLGGDVRIEAATLLILAAAGQACSGREESMPPPPATHVPAPPPAAVRLGQEISDAQVVPMTQLLSAPEQFNKQAVSVVGFLDPPPFNCSDCGTVLCFHKEDADNRLFENCLGVILPDLSKVSRLTHRYVRVQGMVSVARYRKYISVSISDVRQIEAVPNREQWAAGLGAQ